MEAPPETRDTEGIEVTPRSDGLVARWPRGEVRVFEQTPGVYLQVWTGHATARSALPVQAFLDRMLAERARVATALDMHEVVGYDDAFRIRWSKWLESHRDRLDGPLVLVRPKVIRMRVSVFPVLALTLARGKDIYGDRKRFDAAVSKLGTEPDAQDGDAAESG